MLVDAGGARVAGRRGAAQQGEAATEQVERRAIVAERDVRRAGSRPAAEPAAGDVQRAVVVGAGVGDHGGGAHDEADLHREVVDERLDVVHAALGHDARRVARVGLLRR